MAENAKIAALRAASSEAPQGPSGPQALVYPWMTAAGRELVIPERAPIDQQAWRDSRLPKPKPPSPTTTTGPRIPIGPNGKSVLPPNVPLPPSSPRKPFDGPLFPGGSEPIEDRIPINPNQRRYEDDSFLLPVDDTQVYKPSIDPTAQEPAYYTQEPAPREALSEPVYFDPGQFSYVPEPPAAPSPATETAPQEPSAPIEWQPNFFVEGYTGDALVAAPAPAPAPAPSPDLAMYDPALLEMLQQQEDPMAQMQMAYADPYALMAARYFEQ